MTKLPEDTLQPLPPTAPGMTDTGVEYDDLPASYAQQRLWFIDQLEPGNPVYNIPLLLRLDGALQADLLQRCIAEVVQRHETLRTQFVLQDGQLLQRVWAQGRFDLQRHDLSALPAAASAREVQRLAALEAAHGFDLGRGPLLRACLLSESPERHLLLLNLHHIIADGWSLQCFFAELAALYRAHAAGQDSPLPELAVQYADHAQWEREQLQGAALAEPLAYWRGQLAGAPVHLDLPTDRPRPAKRSWRGAQHRLALSAPLCREVQAWGERHGLTPFMTLLAAYELLLWRHSGQADFCVGVPVAGRHLSEVEPLIGLFVNTLVMRVRPDPAHGFLAHAQQVRRTALEAFEHQQLPFEKLVEAMQPDRSLAQTPLFQTMFTLQAGSLDDLSMPGLKLQRLDTEIAVSKFDLSLFLQGDDSLSGYLEYASDLFEPATIARLADQFQHLLQAAVATPLLPIADLPLLDAAQRDLLLQQWNATRAALPASPTLAAAFEAQVRRCPEAVALTADSQSVTYAELNARANRLGHRLQALGVGPEDRVALCLERSVEMVVALLAVLKAGGAYVPLDPAYPPARLAYMLDDARPRVLLTRQRLLPLLLGVAADGAEAGPPGLVESGGAAQGAPDALRLCLLDDVDAALQAWPETDPAPQARPLQPAYVIYTSGSTGQPKGVVITHHAVLNFLQAMAHQPGLAADAVVLNLTSLSFDIAVLELLLPLLNGARCVLAPPGAAADPQALAALIEQQHVTLVQATPSSWRLLLDHAWPANGDRLQALCGGESLPPEQADRLLPRCAALWNLYGPTETTVWSSLDRVVGTAPDQVLQPRIGRPIANTRLYVLDDRLAPVPIGVAGELYIAGLGLARGYLRRPGLTAERFLPDPFASDGSRMYRSGDRACWGADGRLQHLGRADHQIKLRGHRIEPGEIESALLAQPGVRQAVVLLREDSPGDQRLVAYVVADTLADPLIDSVGCTRGGADDPDHADAGNRLLAGLARSLPEPMLPSHLVLLPALPLTPNGKLDRQALPAPGQRRAAPGHAEPITTTERQLAAVWALALGTDRVGRHDNFFALGGHSLLAIQVVAELRRQHQVVLPLRQLFEAPTLRELAAALDEAAATALSTGEADMPPLQALTPQQRQEPLQLSFSQQRLWFLEQLQPGSALYNMAAAVQLQGPLQPQALREALQALVQRHESLRTRFVDRQGAPVQVIDDSLALPLPLHDLSMLPSEARDARAQALRMQEASAPFQLDAGPLLRVQLLRLQPEDHQLLLTLHHIVSDGWSMNLLVRDLVALYRARLLGQPADLPTLTLQYADYAHWQRQWLAGPTLKPQLAYWQQQLHGAPALLSLPTDRPRPSQLSGRGGNHSATLDPATLATLEVLARSQGTTVFMVLAAAFKVLLWRLSGQDDVCLGTPVANRGRAEIAPLIGFFVNTLVLRSRLGAGMRFTELLPQVRETALGAFAHQDLPFEQLVDALQVQRQMSHAPLFQVMLAEQTAPLQQVQLPGVTLQRLPTDSGIAKFDLTLYVTRLGDHLALDFEYASDVFDAATIARWAGHFNHLLQAALQTPETPIVQLPLLAPPERGQLLQGWNDTRTDYPSGHTLTTLFEAQVRRTPDATALVFEDQALSYAQLNAQANRLANRLRAMGLRPDGLAALCLERSPDMVLALLAVHKAGGAYVPLDPTYPAARLARMLADAGPQVLLTQQRWVTRLPESLPLCVLDLPNSSATDWPEANLPPLAGPCHLAYVIYTSGSSGQPKGVAIDHAGIVNRLQWMQQAYRLTADDRVLQKTPYGFDVSVWEFFWPLLEGACLVLARPGGHQDAAYLAALISSQRISTLHFVPPMLDVFLGNLPAGWQAPALRQVMCSGQALPAELQRRFFQRLPAVALHNLYGPTEASVDVTAWACRPQGGPACAPHCVPIGRPIANLQILILDQALQPVPIGVAGELYIAGVGLARGYLQQPALTAERFLPNPHSAQAGSRMYRSGDAARWLPDGQIDYLGRLDNQIKLRGFRIELGEIEAALGACAGVRDAVVTAREDSPGDTRLVAYLVPGEEVADDAEGAAQRDAEDDASSQVDEWRAVFDSAYQSGSEARPAAPADFNIAGWNSRFGGAIPEADMREWLTSTLARLQSLSARRVLEVGCGTGMLLFRLAPGCSHYTATDISAASLAYVQAHRDSVAGGLPQLQLMELAADGIGALDDDFDLVIINSVAQYFPGLDYLLNVIRLAMQRLQPEGVLFLGDVHNLALLPAFASSLVLHGADDSTPLAAARHAAQREAALESELLIDPALFGRLAQSSGVDAAAAVGVGYAQVWPKAGRLDNELNRYRYDVVLHRRPARPAVLHWLHWQHDRLSLDALDQRLAEGADVLALAAVPNARVAGEAQTAALLEGTGNTLRCVGDLRAMRDSNARALPTLADFEALAERHGCGLEASWIDGATDGSLRLLFTRGVTPDFVLPQAAVGVAQAHDLRRYASSPRRARFVRRLGRSAREQLALSLPDYMIPSHWVVLGALPLTVNGKVDRAALPAPLMQRGELGWQAPQSAAEVALAAIWAQVLGIDRVGLHDDFFALGGHSLLATQVVARLRSTLGVELALRAVFEAPTLAAQAQRVALLQQAAQQAPRAAGEDASDAGPQAAAGSLAPIPRAPREAAPELSFAQQRLWFLDQLQPGSALYNMPAALRLSGSLQPQALAQALALVLQRHEALRTRFVTVQGQPLQHIEPAPGPALHTPLDAHSGQPLAAVAALALQDLSDLAPAEREARALWLAQDEAQTPFDLERGSLLRARLLRLQPDEHLLLLTLHHIAGDGWSLRVLVHELATAYADFLQQRPCSLPALPIQYADYAHWQRQWLAGALRQRQLDYWRTQLADAPALLALPTDHPRPALQGQRGASLGFDLDASTTAGLSALARRCQATPFMVLAAALDVLLWRHSGQSDICIGTPIANRGRAETEPLIGLFVNTLVLRCRLDPALRFEQLVAQVRETALGAYAHQDLPFEQVVEALKIERQLSHSPLFQVMLAVDTTAQAPLGLPGLRLEPLDIDSGIAKFDLTLYLAPHGTGLRGRFEYSTALFEPATIARLGGHLRTLLGAALARPACRIDELPLIDAPERALLLRGINQAWLQGPAAGPHQTLATLFEDQVRRSPQATALLHRGQAFSFAELNARANRLARGLRSMGLGRESCAALCMDRSVELIVAMLAVLKAGGAYVPLDPAYPAERLALMFEDAQAVVLLTQAHLLAVLPPDHAVPLCVVQPGGWVEGLAALSGEDLPHSAGLSATAQDLAYVIYTSGSTGRPKGVAIEHLSAVTLMLWARETFSPAQRAGMLASTSVCFDLSVFEIFVPLCWGTRMILVDNALAFADLPDKAGVSFFNTVPSAMAELLKLGLIPPGLAVVGLAGEPLPNALAQGLYRAGVGSVFNLYGPSEDTTYSTFTRVAEGSERAVCIGRAVAQSQLYVLDARGQPLPMGVAGELFIGGQGLARGYLRRPGLTAERFVPDPFSTEPGRRLYRTGDLVRWRGDGELEFLGRLDHQVKLRGYRIELGEIEAALLAHAALAETLVMLREDAPAPRAIVAYLVAQDPAAPGAAPPLSPEALRAHLRRSLPEYMLPSHFVWLAALPLSPNGKIDRKALPAPQRLHAPAALSAAPATPTQRRLAALWASLLGLDSSDPASQAPHSIGLDDNFFDLGGHSLLLLQAQHRLGEVHPAANRLSLIDLYTYPTLRSLAAHLDQPAAPAAVPIADMQQRAARQKQAQQKQRAKHQMSKDD